MDSVAALAVGTANRGLTTSFTQHNGIFEIAPGVKNTDWQELRLSTNSPINDWEKAVDNKSQMNREVHVGFRAVSYTHLTLPTILLV